MMNVYHLLTLAEQVAEDLGDPNWFRESYTRHREYWGIHISIERALDEQGLWPEFDQRASLGVPVP